MKPRLEGAEAEARGEVEKKAEAERSQTATREEQGEVRRETQRDAE